MERRGQQWEGRVMDDRSELERAGPAPGAHWAECESIAWGGRPGF